MLPISRSLVIVSLLATMALAPACRQAPRPTGERPNFVVIFCDDLGYGDIRAELLSKVVDGASGGDLILPDSVDEFHIFNDLSQAAVAL